MKRFATLFLLPALVALVGACDRTSRIWTVTSLGTPYDLFVVAPNQVWQGEAGDTVQAIFGQEVEMINQPEPIYTLYHIPPAGYSKTLQKHRNILILRVDDQYRQADMSAVYDQDAKPQLIVTAVAPTAAEMARFLNQYRTELVRLFDIAERDRYVLAAKSYSNREVTKRIREKFGLSISIPDGYTIRNDAENFLWVSHELPLSSIGFIIYTYPADTRNPANNRKAGNILSARNAAVSQVPGPSQGSFMSTSTTFLPDQKLLTVHGRQWNQVRGFWDVTGDFMGGPFINYTTYDEQNHRMIAIDGYVYAPSPNEKIGKRNYIRQIEAIFVTATLP